MSTKNRISVTKMSLKILCLMLTGIVLVKSDVNCENGSKQCFEKEFLGYIDNFKNSTKIGDFLVLEKINGTEVTKDSDEGIVRRSLRFLQEHELKLRIPVAEIGRSMSGRCKVIIFFIIFSDLTLHTNQILSNFYT